jgi:hypothetical protein
MGGKQRVPHCRAGEQGQGFLKQGCYLDLLGVHPCPRVCGMDGVMSQRHPQPILDCLQLPGDLVPEGAREPCAQCLRNRVNGLVGRF